MPAAEKDLETSASLDDLPPKLPFPPVTRSHILNCSYHSWYSRYRSHIPKARLVPLPSSFISYLRADGIILPPDDQVDSSESDDGPSGRDQGEESDDESSDPSTAWPETHVKIKETIAELGGSVMPKLNWSAPKDATWISATNNMDCRTANDVYLLLKSSDFVTHDLEQAFDGCVDFDTKQRHEEEGNSRGRMLSPASALQSTAEEDIPYHLVLRKTIPAFNPSMEFRCFVRENSLLCICQRDLNHYDFLPHLLPTLRRRIQDFFQKTLRHSFQDPNFAFDVYIPAPYTRVWLIDINPWAPRTDPILFSWLEILDMPTPGDFDGDEAEDSSESEHERNYDHGVALGDSSLSNGKNVEEISSQSSADEDLFELDFRLVNRDDPEAYRFSTPQYSAHKLPKDVVDASVDGEAGMREFIGRWREIVRKQEEEEAKGEESIDDAGNREAEAVNQG